MQEKIVCRVRYLQGSYQDARSTEHKMVVIILNLSWYTQGLDYPRFLGEAFL